MIFNLFLAFIVSSAREPWSSEARRVSSAAQDIEDVLHEARSERSRERSPAHRLTWLVDRPHP